METTLLAAKSRPSEAMLTALPVFPLASTVLMPGMLMPLHVFEPRYRALVDFAMQHDGWIGIPCLRPPEERTPGGLPAFEPVFGLGRIVSHELLDGDRRFIQVEGIGRVKLVDESKPIHAFRQVHIQTLDEDTPNDQPLLQVMRSAFEKLSREHFQAIEGLTALLDITDARVMLYAMSAVIPILELNATHASLLAPNAREKSAQWQQQCLAAQSADLRASLVLERLMALKHAFIEKHAPLKTTQLN